jgi:hypothetical protein
MSKGVLLFARDTETRSYTNMAAYCAKRVKQYLKLPVALVTDIDAVVDETIYDHVIRVSPETQSQNRKMSELTQVERWRNFNRYQAYNLSPYTETILMDTDYIVNSTRLLHLFDMNQPFMCHKRRIYLGKEKFSEIESFGRDNDMYWATVVYFKRSREAESIFNMMQMIQENYDHYSKIYRFSTGTFRNDFAISIAINAVYGHIMTPEVEIPWPLMNVEFTTDVKKLNQDSYELNFERVIDQDKKKFKITTYRQDLHILNKDALFTIIENDK